MGTLSRAYSTVLRKYPTVIQSLQAGMLMGAGDAVSQIFVERKSMNEYEIKRTLRFFTVGTLIVGPALKVWYGVLDKGFGSLSGKSAMKKVLVDQGVFAPFFLGCMVGVLQLSSGMTVAQTEQYIKDEYFNILSTNYMVWPAVQIINFRFVPLHHQVLTVQVVALFWNTYLAWKTNANK